MRLSPTIRGYVSLAPCLLAAGLLAGPAAAQRKQLTAETPKPAPATDVLARVSGAITDLNRSQFLGVLYTTREREVGAFKPRRMKGQRRTVFATAATDPFSSELRAVAENPDGEIIVVDASGNLYRVFETATPAVKFYDDLWMIQDATDLVIAEDGSHVIASQTPSSGSRGTNRISADGDDWAYLIVRNSPVQLVADPLTDDILMADEAFGGKIRSIDGSCPTHPLSLLNPMSGIGFDSSDDDGDMVCEADGDIYVIAGTEVWFQSRTTGLTTLFASSNRKLSGITIAESTTDSGSATGWSLYIAEGTGPSIIREIPGVQSPASLIAAEWEAVPDRGDQLLFAPVVGLQIQEIAKDNNGNLLLGGHLYQTDFQIQRYNTSTGVTTLVAHQSDGLTGVIRGLVVAPDDTIYALTRAGKIHAITENPLVITTVYSDPTNLIGSGCSLARDVNGSFYISDRDFWGSGELVSITAGVATSLIEVGEARGIAADPAGGGLYLSVWNNSGFAGAVNRYDFQLDSLTLVTGFDELNYSNGEADGDLVVDVAGSIYSASGDDWSVARYDPGKLGYTRVGSGYFRALSGLEIAPSTPGSGSTTGWSLYISDHDTLFERPSVLAPASEFVDSAGGARIGARRGAISPALGVPRDIATATQPVFASDATKLWIAMSTATILELDTQTQSIQRVAGPEHGLFGDLVAIERRIDGTLLVANRSGILFSVDPERGYATEILLDDRAGTLGEISGIALETTARGERIVITGARGVFLFEHGVLRPRWLASERTGAPLRPAVDPITHDLFLTEQRGTLRRVSAAGARGARTRVARPDGLSTLVFHGGDGGIIFGPDGDLFVASAGSGRVSRFDRRTGRAQVLSAGYRRPIALAIGANSSLFVLDGWTIYEIRADEFPSPHAFERRRRGR